jgi:hypothetical protein
LLQEYLLYLFALQNQDDNDDDGTSTTTTTTTTTNASSSEWAVAPWSRPVRSVDRESLFLPLGWDTKEKIAILQPSFPIDLYINKDSDDYQMILDDYHGVFPMSGLRGGGGGGLVGCVVGVEEKGIVRARDEQEFLAAHFEVLKVEQQNRKSVESRDSLQSLSFVRKSLHTSQYEQPAVITAPSKKVISADTVKKSSEDVSAKIARLLVQRETFSNLRSNRMQSKKSMVILWRERGEWVLDPRMKPCPTFSLLSYKNERERA